MLALDQQLVLVRSRPQPGIWLWVARRTRDHIPSPSNLLSAFRHPHTPGVNERSGIQHDQERWINAGMPGLLRMSSPRIGINCGARSPTPPNRPINDLDLSGPSWRTLSSCRDLLDTPAPGFDHPKLVVPLDVLLTSVLYE
jgi:hypothetical protein